MSNDHVNSIFATVLDSFDKVFVPAIEHGNCRTCGREITGIGVAESMQCHVCAPARSGWEDLR